MTPTKEFSKNESTLAYYHLLTIYHSSLTNLSHNALITDVTQIYPTEFPDNLILKRNRFDTIFTVKTEDNPMIYVLGETKKIGGNHIISQVHIPMIDFRSITHDHHLAKSITDEIRNMTEWLPEPFRISPYDEPFVGLTTSYIERIIDFENVSAVADDVVRAVQSFDTLRSVFGEWTQSPTMKMLGVNVPII